MNEIVIYCKSYHKDVTIAKRLFESIKKYNMDNIPFYISVPKNDMELFRNVLGNEDYILFPDEDIDTDNHGHKGQQIVKSQFYKLGICKNYLCIDSDNIFIRPFYKTDFLFDSDTPYTICHEYKSLFEFLDKHVTLPFDPYEGFVKERKFVMDLFGRKGPVFDFGPDPVIWSCKVWKSLVDNYVLPNNLKFSDIIHSNPSEFSWYGEWLLAKQDIRLIPIDPLFKSYHYPDQFKYDQEHDYNIEKLAKHYMGIGLQSIYFNN